MSESSPNYNHIEPEPKLLSKEEQELAGEKLKWPWSPRAKQLLTSFSRLTTMRHHTFEFLSLDALEEVLVRKTGSASPAILDVQRELCGIVFPTLKDPERHWIRLGIYNIESIEDQLEDWEAATPGESAWQLFAEYKPSSLTAYSINNDGLIFDECQFISNAFTLIERMALYKALDESLDIPKQPSYSTNHIKIYNTDLKKGNVDIINAANEIMLDLGWKCFPPANDDWSCIWYDDFGKMFCTVKNEYDKPEETILEVVFFCKDEKIPYDFLRRLRKITGRSELPIT